MRDLLGTSAAIHRIRMQVSRAAQTDVPVLITGESGTGKEVAAQCLHAQSRRAANNFFKVNCPAIPYHLFESELFGYMPGAFTGAKEARAGKFELADKGTLFLDEIGELEFSLQSKLLHALQDSRVVRLGSTSETVVDFRLICATNRHLEEEVAQGGFRADLFYRINVLRIEMPSLRERPTDVPILMNYFLELYGNRLKTRYEPLSPSFMQLLQCYHWPGNIRELENLAKRYVVLGEEEHILSVLREPRAQQSASPDLTELNIPLKEQTKRAIQIMERQIILKVLQAHQWNRRKTARSLDISYRALLYKIKEAGLPTLRPARRPVDVDGPAKSDDTCAKDFN